MYAQVGLDREQGFFVIGSETPVYRDQRRLRHLLKDKQDIYLSEETKWTGNRAASCIGTCFFWGMFVGSFWDFSHPDPSPARPRWQIRWHELGKGYSITNLKSQRSFAASGIHCAIVEFAWCCTSWHASPSPLLSTATWSCTFVLPKVSLAVQLGFVTAFHFSMVLLGSPVHFQENLEGLSFFTIHCN